MKNNQVVLIAEDDDISFQFLQTVLNKMSISSLRAKNGEQAVNICLNSPEVKIVFMDIKMPKLDGLSATKRIKAVRPDVIIIAQTAYALNSEKAELLREGCDDYISKPIDMDLFIKIVKKYLNLNE